MPVGEGEEEAQAEPVAVGEEGCEAVPEMEEASAGMGEARVVELKESVVEGVADAVPVPLVVGVPVDVPEEL